MAKSFAEVYGGQDSGPNNKVGTFESMLAGVGSGLIAIPKVYFHSVQRFWILESIQVKPLKLKNGLTI